jgi:hypothetical protein
MATTTTTKKIEKGPARTTAPATTNQPTTASHRALTHMRSCMSTMLRVPAS